MRRTYAEEFFRQAVMIPSGRRGGLETWILSSFALVAFILFLIGKGIYHLVCFGMTKSREEHAKEECFNKFKNDIKLTNYTIYYQAIDGNLNNSYGELSMRVNFIAYDSEKEDMCVCNRRLQEVMKHLGYDLRIVRGQYLHEDNRRYVFTTDEEMKHMASMLSNKLSVPVQFKGYN